MGTALSTPLGIAGVIFIIIGIILTVIGIVLLIVYSQQPTIPSWIWWIFIGGVIIGIIGGIMLAAALSSRPRPVIDPCAPPPRKCYQVCEPLPEYENYTEMVPIQRTRIKPPVVVAPVVAPAPVYAAPVP